jgi:hypothetical protein
MSLNGCRSGKALPFSSEIFHPVPDTRQFLGAFRGGAISLDQATEIAKAEQARPGAASEPLSVARAEAFQVLRERARDVVHTLCASPTSGSSLEVAVSR